MTLAPERHDVAPELADPRSIHSLHATLPPTEPHHEGSRHERSQHHSLNSRLSVASAEPRPQRPAFKKSGRPNPAAHLTPTQIEDIGRELDELRAQVMDSRGARDAAYIRRVIATQRWLEAGSRAVLLFSGVKVSVRGVRIRPAWWIGTAGLSIAKILENMEIGHNVMHGQWDWMRDPKIHSKSWEWDNVSPSSQWKHTHNEIHHTYTNVVGRDNDLGYGILRVDEDQKWTPFTLGQPLWHWVNAVMFEYSIAAYDLELGEKAQRWQLLSDAEKAAFWAEARKVVAKIRRQALKDYVAHPALAMLTGSGRATLSANVTANLVRNLWTNTVIVCGHFPEGVETFEKTSIEGETRGDWYLRQMLGSANISGSRLMHTMTGNLSHQIEHHLYPDMPSNRYIEIAPQVRDLMRRYDLHYVTGSLPRQFASVYKRIVLLSVPEAQPGKSRVRVIRDAVARQRRTRKALKRRMAESRARAGA